MNADLPPPLRRGSDRIAAALNAVLVRAAFTERSICERLGIPALTDIDLPLFKTLAGRLTGAGPLEVLARLFVFGEAVDRAILRAHLSQEELDAFMASDLLRTWEGSEPGGEHLFSPVRLVPVELPRSSRDLLVVGDRGDHPDGSPFVPFSDIVFSGHNPLTRQFLRLLPQSRCGEVLDLCAGTGVAALAMAPSAEGCTAGDVAERSVHFAKFNAWLNHCDTLNVVCGDLYAPVEGRRFDRILAHPPYVPALTHKLTYRDGGQTGDEIVRRVVAGAPDHLNEGGTFHLLCLGIDTLEATFEQRARAWLGEAGREFDIIFALDSRTPPDLIATRLVDRAGGLPQDLERWRELFESLRVKEFVYGMLAGRRFASHGAGEAFTRRVLLTDESTGEGFEWLFRWFDWLRLPDLQTRVMTLTPTLPSDLRLDVSHSIENNAFVPIGYGLSNGGRPFFAKLETDAWVAALLTEFDGLRTVRETFDRTKDRGRIPPAFGEVDLVRLICFLLERGCVLAETVAPCAS